MDSVLFSGCPRPSNAAIIAHPGQGFQGGLNPGPPPGSVFPGNDRRKCLTRPTPTQQSKIKDRPGALTGFWKFVVPLGGPKKVTNSHDNQLTPSFESQSGGEKKLPWAASGALLSWELSRKKHNEPQTDKAKQKFKDKPGALTAGRRFESCTGTCFSIANSPESS
jgi:hypothetical protein